MLGKWKKIKTEEVYQCGEWYRIEKDKVLTPGGEEGIYYTVRGRNSVAIIPIDKNGRIYLTKQHRYASNMFTLEIPAGNIDKNENQVLAARRELEEETGFTSENIKKIGKFSQVLGISNTEMNIFLAKDLIKKSYPKVDPLDKNLHETKRFTYQELSQYIANGKIIDAVTLSSFAIAESQGFFDKYKK